MTVRKAVSFVAQLRERIKAYDDRDILIIPPFTALWPLKDSVHAAGFYLGAQNCHWEPEGAYTGEISPLMLKDVGCEFVLVGHSERRHLFGESDETVGKKIRACFQYSLTPILCIGEKLSERESGLTFDVVKRQLSFAIQNLTDVQVSQLIIAYEPVWAIGTGKTASPGQAQEVHSLIRKFLSETFNENVANQVRILYGGSVKPENVDELMAQIDIDGTLVGGASLKVESFARIVNYQSL